MIDHPNSRVRRRMGGGLGAVVTVVGAAVCLGWFLHSTTLVQIDTGLAPMKFNTALCLGVLGMSLIFWALERPKLSKAAAALVLILAGLTIIEHISGYSFGIDTLFVTPFTLEQTRHPGRMSYYAGCSFVALAAVMLFDRNASRRGGFLVLGSGVCAGVMVLTCASLIGYATGYRLPLSGGTNMAFHTAIAFLSLSWGVLMVVCPSSNGRHAGLVNALLAVPIAATSLGVVLALWLLPAVSGHSSDGGPARPFGPVVAILAVTACMVAASLVAARIGFHRAAFMKSANSRLTEEIAQREQIESAQRLLVSELDHRVRNTLSQVLALAETTSQTVTSVEQYHARFRDRVRALSRAHSVLARTRRNDTDLGEFLRAVLEPFAVNGDARIALSGPPVVVPSRATTALCVVFYELAANAAKHGALRAPDGRVDLSWRVLEGDPQTIEIEWRESGGPAVAQNPESGFGTDLIRNMVPHELGGRTELTFAPEGVRCRVRLELSPATADPPAALAPKFPIGSLAT